MKFGTKTNSNVQNSMVMFTFSVFDQKYPFLGKLVAKLQNYFFKGKFGTYTDSNVQNLMLMLTFSVFALKYPFWTKLLV